VCVSLSSSCFIHVIDLLLFRTRPSSAGSKITRVWFPLGASWADLVGHCEKEHPAACEEFEKLSPCQVVELRQRMLGNKVPRKF